MKGKIIKISSILFILAFCIYYVCYQVYYFQPKTNIISNKLEDDYVQQLSITKNENQHNIYLSTYDKTIISDIIKEIDTTKLKLIKKINGDSIGMIELYCVGLDSSKNKVPTQTLLLIYYDDQSLALIDEDGRVCKYHYSEDQHQFEDLINIIK